MPDTHSTISQPTATPPPRSPLAGALYWIVSFVTVYAVFAGILSSWVGLCRVLNWSTDLRFLALTPEPYDNVFARVAAWCGLCAAASLVESTLWHAVGRRIPNAWVAGGVRFLVVYLLFLGLQCAWLLFAQLVGGKTELTLDWSMDGILDNVVLRAALWSAALCTMAFLKNAERKADAAENADSQPLVTLNRLILGFGLLVLILGGAAFALSQLFGQWVWIVFVPAVLCVPVLFSKVPRHGDPH